jgi:hypothetical protein
MYKVCCVFACGLPLLLTSCASVSVVPLDYQGQPTGEAPGIRYYMPKPYLLVTQAPDKTSHNNGAGAGAGPAAPTDGSSDPTAKGSGSPSPSSDLSYQIGGTTYLLKLIYLPDKSKTMAINLVPGIFGTSSMQPTLQDGWMLTSLQASSDNSKAIDDLTSLATAMLGAGGKAASGGAAAAAKKNQGAGAALVNADPVLPPGLYEFRYDDYGNLIGLCTVSTFSAGGVYNTRVLPAGVATRPTTKYCPTIADLVASSPLRVKG